MKLALRSDIGLANRIVPMTAACTAIGMHDVDYGMSGKIDCPFATIFHNGSGKSFRIYDTGAYCFACNERYSPVSLYATAKDISLDDAAEELLNLVGYKPPTAEERFSAAMDNAFRPDGDSLAAALKTYCARTFPAWTDRELDDDVAARFRKCADLLQHVRTADDAVQWLAVSKIAMTKVLGES